MTDAYRRSLLALVASGMITPVDTAQRLGDAKQAGADRADVMREMMERPPPRDASEPKRLAKPPRSLRRA